jgi:acyl-CoA reductase-like NAD-dependent aldehyde dehydrogenase
MSDPTVWRLACPGDLSEELPEIAQGNVDAAVAASLRAFPAWRALTLDERMVALRAARDQIKLRQEDLARLISLEVGKPLREARLELGAVVAKFDFVFADAERYIAEQTVTDGPHPASVRHRARGPAAVIAPFNFPIHLGHGAAVAYLLAGNTVIFKPSPLAANVGLAYAHAMQSALPDGVFELVQGWGEIGQALCLHPAVRSICFTGSVPVGTALARDLAADYSKSLALELGGKNSFIVCADADLELAATAAADGICLTTGQRCNSTSRLLVDARVESAFYEKLCASLHRYQPGDPRDENTLLGPLVSAKAVDRYAELLKQDGYWTLPGEVCGEVNGLRGYYVRPAILRSPKSIPEVEAFSPIATLETFADLDEIPARHAAVSYGLTASIFTASSENFHRIGDGLEVGNLYHNLPTTFSPSTLPFGGLGASGNGKPGGRGFIRFATEEQAVQWKVS